MIIKSGKIRKLKDLVNLGSFFTEIYDAQNRIFALKFDKFTLPVNFVEREIDKQYCLYHHINIQDIPKELFEKFTEEIDWAIVEQDSKVLVSDDGKTWHRRHFAYVDGRTNTPYVWMDGKTSWTHKVDPNIEKKYIKKLTEQWGYTKLAEQE